MTKNEDKILTDYGARFRADGSMTVDLDVPFDQSEEWVEGNRLDAAIELAQLVDTEYEIGVEEIGTLGPIGWPVFRFHCANPDDMRELLIAYVTAATATDFVPKLPRREQPLTPEQTLESQRRSPTVEDDRPTLEVDPDLVSTYLAGQIVQWLVNEGRHGATTITVGTITSEFTGGGVTEDDVERALGAIIRAADGIEASQFSRITVRTYNPPGSAINDDMGLYP
jgi:hypothetical protein